MSCFKSCFVPGACVGQLIGTLIDMPDPQDCLSACKETANCEWFTSDGQIEICNLFASCIDVDVDECPHCLSGKYIFLAKIPKPNTELTKIGTLRVMFSRGVYLPCSKVQDSRPMPGHSNPHGDGSLP